MPKTEFRGLQIPLRLQRRAAEPTTGSPAQSRVNILHRYLFRELFLATVGGVSLFAFVLLSFSAIKDLLGRVADGVLTAFAAVQLSAILLPYVVTFALPVGLLMAILLTLGRASAQHEITAMRASGIGLLRIAAPVLLIAAVSSAACVVINLSYAPSARAQYREILSQTGRTNPINLIVPGTFNTDFEETILYVGERDGGQLRDVWLWRTDEDNYVELFISAREGEVIWDEEANTLAFRLRSGQFEIFDPTDLTKPPRPLIFDERPAEVVPLDDIFKRRPYVKKVSHMNFRELQAEKARLEGSETPEDRERLIDVKMNIHEKAAMGFTVFSFAVVGVPLGIKTGRSETSANFGLALLLAMAAYTVMFASAWIKDRPELHPELLLWLPNVAFQAIGAWLWMRLGKN